MNSVDINKVYDLFDEINIPKKEGLSILCGAIGMQAEESADKMCVAPSTIRKHQENAKAKIGKGKMVEVAGLIICQALGVSYDFVVEQFKEAIKSELAKRIVSIVILVSFSYGIMHNQETERRFRTRNNRTEILSRTRREL